MSSKNLGQVAGVFISSTPPSNINLIWFDNTPSQMCHKVYNVGTSRWDILEEKIISIITYSELVNIAKTVGLSVGKFFQITDRANALALAITTTKVQYVDVAGNLLIDDLGTNIQYIVPATNIQLDDIEGEFDDDTKTLTFLFKELSPSPLDGDYLLGKALRNDVWSLAKYKLSSFVSVVSGNSISWNGGFYFNFSSAVASILDKTGGIVSKEVFDESIKTLTQNINSVSKDNQELLAQAMAYTDVSTSPEQIYQKVLYTDLTITGEPIDVAKGDTFVVALSKIQRFINKFKRATGILLSDNFVPYPSEAYPNSNDTMETAMSKMAYWINRLKITDGINTPTTFTQGSAVDITPGDNVTVALGKLQALAKAVKGTGDIADGSITPAKLSPNFDLPNGTTGTTQNAGTNNSLVATTAFTQTAKSEAITAGQAAANTAQANANSYTDGKINIVNDQIKGINDFLATTLGGLIYTSFHISCTAYGSMTISPVFSGRNPSEIFSSITYEVYSGGVGTVSVVPNSGWHPYAVPALAIVHPAGNFVNSTNWYIDYKKDSGGQNILRILVDTGVSSGTPPTSVSFFVTMFFTQAV